MDNNDDLKNKDEEKIEIVVGDTSELAFSEVGDYMGDLKPKDIKGSKKNIIIPTNKKNVNSSNSNDDTNDECDKSNNLNTKTDKNKKDNDNENDNLDNTKNNENNKDNNIEEKKSDTDN